MLHPMHEQTIMFSQFYVQAILIISYLHRPRPTHRLPEKRERGVVPGNILRVVLPSALTAPKEAVAVLVKIRMPVSSLFVP